MQSPNTARRPGKASRVIPVFAELRPFQDSFDAAPEGARYMIGEGRWARADSPGGWRNGNLRTHIERIVRRAGLELWPRRFRNLRASRETELVRAYPLHVVTARLGHRPKAARKRCLMTVEEDFQQAAEGFDTLATGAPRDPAQRGAATGGVTAIAQSTYSAIRRLARTLRRHSALHAP